MGYEAKSLKVDNPGSSEQSGGVYYRSSENP